nr:interleukin 17D-like protein [Tegillarca granosa]
MAGTVLLNFEVVVIVNFIIQVLHTQSYPSCRQPNHYPNLRHSDNLTVETELIVPGQTVHGVGDLIMIPCEFQNIRLEDFSGSKECSSYTNLDALSGSRIDPVSIRSTCPFYYQRNIDGNRVPSVLMQATCACRSCIEGDSTMACKEIYIYTTVLRRDRSCGNGSYNYIPVREPLSVGCTCTRNGVIRPQQPGAMLHR